MLYKSELLHTGQLSTNPPHELWSVSNMNIHNKMKIMKYMIRWTLANIIPNTEVKGLGTGANDRGSLVSTGHEIRHALQVQADMRDIKPPSTVNVLQRQGKYFMHQGCMRNIIGNIASLQHIHCVWQRCPEGFNVIQKGPELKKNHDKTQSG